MLKNYFKTALRSLRKHKVFSVVNIMGLSVGLAAAIFIFQYTFFELSFDDFNSSRDDIYRVMNMRYEGERLIQKGQITYSAVGPQMAEDYPEVLRHTTINSATGVKLRTEDNQIIQADDGIWAHPSFLEMFDYEILAGDKATMLKELRSMVLTETMAKNLFGENMRPSELIGKTLYRNQDTDPFQVTGIMADAPANSHLHFDILLSRSTLVKFWPNAEFNWQSSDFFHYLQLQPGTDYKKLEAKFDDFSDKYFRGDEVTGTFEKFHLQPLDEVHLFSDYEYERAVTNNGEMVMALVLVAVFILLMAWINYINLTTSRALERAREVGVRKVVGARKSQLLGQFMMETLVVNGIAVVLAITITQILQQQFNSLIEQDLSVMGLMNTLYGGIPFWVIFTGILLLGTGLSGVYPALILTGYKPTETLKGKFSQSGKGNFLRKGLVIFQFCISTLLIAGTFLVYQQVSYMRAQDLGMDIDRVMVMQGPNLTSFDSTFVNKVHAFKAELKQNPNVLEVGISYNVFGERLPRVFNARVEGSDNGYMLNRMHVDFGFFTSYKIGMASGRNFRADDHNPDGAAVKNVILNSKAAEVMGYSNPEELVNKRINFWGRNWFIVGITEDFHHRSLDQSIEPILFVPFYDPSYDQYSIKMSGQNTRETVAFVESKFNETFPGNMFEYSFMDEQFDRQYKSDQQFGTIFNIFSVLGILIACLGLFGLAGYNALKRTKEIGVRKVLGASVNDILQLLSKDFLSLVLLASTIALPLIYFGADAWLSGYEFRVGISLWLFALPVFIIVAVALTTISYQTLQTARRNPVTALRQE